VQSRWPDGGPAGAAEEVDINQNTPKSILVLSAAERHIKSGASTIGEERRSGTSSIHLKTRPTLDNSLRQTKLHQVNPYEPPQIS
jgi:hypothetical protein